MTSGPMKYPPPLSRFAWLSIGAAIVTIGLKAGAYLVTGSIGLFSDALESGANLVTALLALLVLRIASRPPDEEHAYGHEKAEYFSSGTEGAVILIAAGVIGFQAMERLLHPQPLAQLDLGLAMSLSATLVNLGGSRILLRAGQSAGSIVLQAQAQHLMADVWTSAAVLVGVGIVALTGQTILDPLVALGVCFHVIWVGVKLVRRSILGLMDTALPELEQEAIKKILERYHDQGVQYHALRTRQAGMRSFVSVHVQVPGKWSVQKGHDLLENLEKELRNSVPSTTTVSTHLEPLEDPASLDDEDLDR